MAVSDDQDVANLKLSQLRALRRENTAVLEQTVRLFENQNRLQTAILHLQEEVRDAFRATRHDINSLKSDVLLLEGQNASRHGEILNLVQRVDEDEA